VKTFASIGMLGFWSQADTVGQVAALILLVMSVATWYLILTKSLQFRAARRRGERALEAFWGAPGLEQALERMRAGAPDSPFLLLATEGAAARTRHDQPDHESLAESLTMSEVVTRALRRAMQRALAKLDSGLSLLASVGATAPFVGLFGTVWGIYHALIGIGFTGQATIDKVAGPVGEALIMTAFGIAVAVPAVVGYNFLLRRQRMIAAELDGFAHDLHAYLTKNAARAAAESVQGAVSRRSVERHGH
jgi:biopolymer transport protein ExbB